MIFVGLWNQPVPAGRRVRVHPFADIRITTATFDETLASESGRTTIKLYRRKLLEEDESVDEDDEPEFEDQAIIIASLIPGKIETQILDIILLEDETCEFEVTGKNDVSLVGNFVDQMALPADSHDEDEDDYPEYDSESNSDDDDDEHGVRLEEVSSDVEMDPRELAGLMDEETDDEPTLSSRIEEVVEEAVVIAEPPKEKKDKKRPRESDAPTEAADESVVLTKKEKKKKNKNKNKKLKGEGGVAVPTGEPEPVKEAPQVEKEKEKKKKKDGQPTQEKGDTKSTNEPAKEKDSKKRRKFQTPGGVDVVVAKEGAGPQAKNGSALEMRYIGKFTNGKVFDKNTSGKPFRFTLGKGQVIKGWDEGLRDMRVGAECVLTVPPEMGYGSKKVGEIPPNSTLTFECKVLSIR